MYTKAALFCEMSLAITISVAAITSTASAQEVASCPINKIDPTIKGVYLDNFGGLQSVSATYWNSSDAVFDVCSVDNTRKRIIALNDSRNQYNPGKYSRFEWTTFGNRLWYCQSVYDAPTANVPQTPPPLPTRPIR